MNTSLLNSEMVKKKHETSLRALCSSVQIKTWSLVVTAFGDLASQECDSLSGTQLKALFECMSIKPDALRVALHRLNKDGWIVSERSGRNSDYRLSDLGVAETKKVWQRVYCPVYENTRQWYVAVSPGKLTNNSTGAIKLASQTYIVNDCFLAQNTDAIAFPFEMSAATAWVGKKILKDGIDDASTTLLSMFEKLPDLAMIETDIQRVAIRVLCIHQWRRIVLREAALVHMQHFEDGNIRKCHDQIQQLLKDIPRENAVTIMSEI